GRQEPASSDGACHRSAEAAAEYGAHEKSNKGCQGASNREFGRSSRGEREEDNVPCHVRCEDMAEREHADGIDDSRDQRQHQECGWDRVLLLVRTLFLPKNLKNGLRPHQERQGSQDSSRTPPTVLVESLRMLPEVMSNKCCWD